MKEQDVRPLRHLDIALLRDEDEGVTIHGRSEHQPKLAPATRNHPPRLNYLRSATTARRWRKPPQSVLSRQPAAVSVRRRPSQGSWGVITARPSILPSRSCA